MPLNEFKTQVLLLHSELNTLERLSSRFADRYTVHCATTGSEALQTLGEIAIDVIVSSVSLPGMSGREALREAKKRSPETLGILLDDDKDTDSEALVGEAEVFQVVRGSMTSETIIDLVDNATQQLRLMTLAESANDTAANVDKPAVDYQVAEPSGDSTAASVEDESLPVLESDSTTDPDADNLQQVDLLVLTKVDDFLETIRLSAEESHAVHYASTLAEADEIIRGSSIGVTVIDAGMIGKRIEQLTDYLRRAAPRMVYIVAGRRDDGEMLMDLINRGKVYRFLLKPLSQGRARLAIEASAKYHREAPDIAFTTKAADTASPPAGTELHAWNRRSSSDDGFEGAFGSGEFPLSETISDLFKTVGKKLSGATESDSQDEAPVVETKRRSPLRRTGLFVAGALASAVITAAYFWFFADPQLASVDDNAIADAPRVQQQAIPQSVATAAALGAESERSEALQSTELPGQQPAPQPLEQPAAESVVPAADLAAAETVDASATAAADLAATATAEESTTAVADLAATGTKDESASLPAQTSVEESTDVAPDNSAVAAFNARIDEELAAARAALGEGRLDDADAALQRLLKDDPDNARLPPLVAQLAEERQRRLLNDAQRAIAERRFDDAEVALAAARSANPAGGEKIDAVASRLLAARTTPLTSDILALAKERLEAGALLAPSKDSARYYYELVLKNDRENVAARLGLSEIASRLALQARAEIADGDLQAAERRLDEARTLDPSNRALNTALQALADTRRKAAAERSAREAAAAQSASTATASTTAGSTEKQGTAEESNVGASAAPSSTPAQAEARDSAAANAAATTRAAEPDTASAKDGTAADNDEQPAVDEPVSTVVISSLNRIKYVAPKYPRGAERRNLSGWVDVVFTVSSDGSVTNIEVRDSQPGDTFVKAATDAIEKWQFEPIVENGAIVEKRTGVRLMFAL